MQVPDVFRAQYYLSAVEKEILSLKKDIREFSFLFNPTDLFEKFSSGLARIIDQILLPTITFEVHNLKSNGKLLGCSPEERYESFFVQNGAYTGFALDLVERYLFLFESIDRFISESFLNFRNCLRAFHKDLKLGLVPRSQIKSIDFLESSDRHCSQQSLLLKFIDGDILIYKPVDLFPDQLLREFVELVKFPYPFDLKCLDVMPGKGYGWIQFINQCSCTSINDVENFYRRAGVLIAVADSLNYTDGHCENIFASGSHPILLDGETLFQNYAKSVAKEKNILSTFLIQKADSDSSLYSALQAQNNVKVEGFYTHALNDHTDDIKIGYSGISRDLYHHSPLYMNKFHHACDYKELVIEGYKFGFDWISKKVPVILANEKWWKRVAVVRSRIVLRETSAYYYLLRRIQQPDLIQSKEKTESFLRKKLERSDYTEYEITDLMEMNIPYFYQFPGQKHLFDGKRKVYRDVFSNTAVESMQWQFMNRSEEKKDFDCEILSRHLIPSEQTSFSISV